MKNRLFPFLFFSLLVLMFPCGSSAAAETSSHRDAFDESPAKKIPPQSQEERIFDKSYHPGIHERAVTEKNASKIIFNDMNKHQQISEFDSEKSLSWSEKLKRGTTNLLSAPKKIKNFKRHAKKEQNPDQKF